MKKSLLIIIAILISAGFSQNIYELKDGTVIEGTVVSQTEAEITLLTTFGEITILKRDILIKTYTVIMLSGEKINGEKVYEDETTLVLKNRYGEMELSKSNIQSITENLSVSQNEERLEGDYRRPSGIFGLFSGQAYDKDSEFSLGEEQLVDHFFDPTGHTLDRGVLYLSGLSFGFGINDRIQITTRFPNFVWGDINIRPKINIFKIGNWEKEHSISIGGHYHTRWGGDNENPFLKKKYQWENGSVEVTEFHGEIDETGELNEFLDDGVSNPNYNPNYGLWLQTAAATTTTKHWGGYYMLGNDEIYEQEFYLPDGYDPNAVNTHFEYEPSGDFNDERCDYEYEYDCFDEGPDYNYYQMIEFFGAYTFSKAREHLKGRTSHTLGANIMYVHLDNVPNFYDRLYYRFYYGLDIDINPKLKMLADIFYDPNYLEAWQKWEYTQNDYWDEESFSDSPVEEPSEVLPVHIDFGFIYAFNESFRFGMHFQQPFVSFYWKF